MNKEPWDTPILLVEWLDAEADSAWTTLEEVLADNEIQTCLSVGWFVKETGDFLVIADSKSKDATDHTLGGVLKIPKHWIMKKTELKNPDASALASE